MQLRLHSALDATNEFGADLPLMTGIMSHLNKGLAELKQSKGKTMLQTDHRRAA